MPFFWLVTCHIARNHNVKGSLLPWKMVPAVTETCARHERHNHNPRAIRHA